MAQQCLFVYILLCSNSTYYTGITNNIHRRLSEHQSGIILNFYTARYLPVTLVYYTQFSDFNMAIQWEKKIKSWSRIKKEALIKENWNQLKSAAICKNKSKAVPQ